MIGCIWGGGGLTQQLLIIFVQISRVDMEASGKVQTRRDLAVGLSGPWNSTVGLIAEVLY